MKGAEEQQLAGLENGDKDKRRRRARPNRRAKQIVPPSPGLCLGVQEGILRPSCLSEKQQTGRNYDSKLAEASPSKSGFPMEQALNVEFCSMPNMAITFSKESTIGGSPPLIPVGNSLPVYSGSCPPIYTHGMSDEYSNKDSNILLGQLFATHWSLDAVNEAVEKGEAFKAKFRMNAHNRLEAYCTVDGVPTDVLIYGVAAQNRAVEGDIVAVKLDPVSSWTKLKSFRKCFGNDVATDNCGKTEVAEIIINNCKEKEKTNLLTNDMQKLLGEGLCSEIMNVRSINKSMSSGENAIALNSSDKSSSSLKDLVSLIDSHPWKRPTGRVLAILEKSARRDSIVGFLSAKQFNPGQVDSKSGIADLALHSINPGFSFRDYILMNPADPRFHSMIIPMSCLPESVIERLTKKDETVYLEIIGAKILLWRENCLLPLGQVLHVFGQSRDIEPQIAAIKFENKICDARFSPESIACLPGMPWEIPNEELLGRKDFRSVCTFTIDPPTATDLDDALSVEIFEDVYRVGVHVADVSYFVQPNTPLDAEAQLRSTSVYLLQHKLSMLPPDLSEGIGSLKPGVDRLTLSVVWDIDREGKLLDQWIGHSVINSCCKLSYAQAQMIIDDLTKYDRVDSLPCDLPNLHGPFLWSDIARYIKVLHMISKKLRESRFHSGALWLEIPKPVFMFDKAGVPYESKLYESTDANFLVEEFMLLANLAVAKVISSAFPDCALLRKHPDPNNRKLKEFEAFCSKHGFELDVSSSGNLHFSLSKLREELKNDPVLFDIIRNCATNSMQMATYFCSGDLKQKENEWVHYALAVPCYTHFTSPLRRYPDIIVHRTLSAVIDAGESHFLGKGCTEYGDKIHSKDTDKCFMNFSFDGELAKSVEGEEELSAAASKHKVPKSSILTSITEYCNERKLASRNAEEAGEKLYLWTLLKQKKFIIADARVLALGPKFMTVYIHKFKIERRINYCDVEGLFVYWLETTNKLVLDYVALENVSRKRFHRKNISGKYRPLEDVALVVNPSLVENQLLPSSGDALKIPEGLSAEMHNVFQESMLPAVFPLTLGIFSHLSVAVIAHGEGNPIEIKAKLYMCSHFCEESI